jgi:GTPase SAR1 family protein
VNQYVYQTFGQKYKATIGADFLPKDIYIDDRLISISLSTQNSG